ncbi:DUF805 domain-containing protein [Pseudomaricurvus alkylphenolicus]|jgi:uncharacterized membrane protein YhaH (DUF805 family)|uniref:DUF805 domain-containing protein n=1 Tax=Pseudomaricurvus alkylphenolicus TaxID=1306991 RepID=UPI0014221AF5|nr:DUF805 domain-containing protein [Pseudomaricurvus alkylphenolicus]NIB40953.1 DUF805 domain-containing protein [Pseudomaricurvus alkylphenolicus]
MTENIYESPNSQILNESDEVVSHTVKEILFSFRGRIRRSTYWKSMLGMMGVFLILFLVVGALNVSEGAISLAMLILYLPLMWISFAIQVKRWHDRDKSGWWVLISFVPIIGPIWAFVENGCLAGTETANRFGPPEI